MGHKFTKPLQNINRSIVSIIGLHKARVLGALYNGALYKAPKFDTQPAIRQRATQGKTTAFVRQVIANQLIKEKSQYSDHPRYKFGTIDLGNGPRELAIDLSNYEIDVSEYNALHGDGVAQQIISDLYHNNDHNKNNHPKDEEKECSTDSSDILFKLKHPKRYENNPEKDVYETSQHMLDPSLTQGVKENLCLELMHRSKKHESRNHTIGGTLSYMPAIISAPILVYAPIQTLSTYYEYQHQYGEYSTELRDANFETTLTFLLSNNVIPADAKTSFLNKIDAMFKQRELLDRFNQGEENASLYEAMACWEKKSLLPSISQYFDEAFKHKYDQFKEKLKQAIENPGSRLRLRTEFGSLVVENLLVKHNFDVETLTPIVMHFHDERDMHILDEMYLMHGLVPVAMFKRHLVQLAKLTNDPDHYQFSALFFSSCLKYLKDEAKSIAFDIAASLSSDYYANNAYAFTSIRQELFTYWINQKPEQITAIVKAMLSIPKEQHETAIDKFFFDLSYANMPDSFYDKFAILLSNDLNPDEFIKVYTAASPKIQIKLLSALMQDETQALARLNRLQKTYMEGDYSVVFPRKIASQLQAINPNFYQQDEIERLFHAEQTQDKLETDIVLLQKILENPSLTHDERRSEIRRLENINVAFSDNKTDACPVVMKMFDKIPEKYWPELFVYFDAQIIHWSFPQDEEHLKLFYPDPEKRPAPRENTWLKFQSRWEEVLQGTLKAILKDLNKKRSGSDVAHWALSHVDQAFTKTEEYFPGMVDNILKKFFLENLPQSIKIFEIFHGKFNDKYHAPEYFSQKGIYHQVASWLPEDTETRTHMLVQLLRVEGFEQAFKFPFVRSQKEVADTAFALVNTRKEHIVHLFNRLPRDIVDTIFKSLNQHDNQGFLELLQNVFLEFHEAKLSESSYLYYAVRLLSWCKSADMDIFQIVDADPNKALLLETFSDIKTWENRDTFQQSYHLIFSILYHYKPEEFSTIVFEHIQSTMKERSLYSLCSCIRAIHEVTHIKIELPQNKMNILVDHLKNHMSDALEYSTEIDVLSKYIPDFAKLFLELIAKNIKNQDKLPYNYKACLDALVKNCGFFHILPMCKDLNIDNCCDYLTKKFGKFPDIYEKMEAAIKPYSQLFDKYEYLIEDSVRWSFLSELRSAILEAAKKNHIVIINVFEIAQKSGIPPELMPIVIVMPGIAIKSSAHGVDEEIKKEMKQSVASLIQNSWEKSGLIASSPSPTTPSVEVTTVSPKSKL